MIYMIVPFGEEDDHRDALTEKIKEGGNSIYEDEAPHAWFISYDGTSKELAEKLGLGDDPAVGTGIVVQVNRYNGYASKSLWEWMEIYDK